MPRTGTLLAVVIIAVLALIAWQWRYSPIFSKLFGSAPAGQLVAQAHYQCNGGKTIDASFRAGQSQTVPAGEPPVPTGSIDLVLGDGRTMTLAQTLSADGTRYANQDETFVFWSKGNGALALENNEEKSYIGCIEVVPDPGTLPGVYASGQNGFSLRYPQGYTVDEKHIYQELGPGKDIRGVRFTIDPTLAAGTNLGTDSYLSVEQVASTHSTSSGQASDCTATKFLDRPAAATVWNDGANQYSYATSSGAAAGNRYEEQVFALPGTNPCVAVRYFIHSGSIGNYPEGTVREFNYDALVGQFDSIRKTLIVVQ